MVYPATNCVDLGEVSHSRTCQDGRHRLMHGDGRVMSKSCVVNERASLARIDQARMTTVVDGGQFAPRRQQHMQDYCDKTEADHDLLLKVFAAGHSVFSPTVLVQSLTSIFPYPVHSSESRVVMVSLVVKSLAYTLECCTNFGGAADECCFSSCRRRHE